MRFNKLLGNAAKKGFIFAVCISSVMPLALRSGLSTHNTNVVWSASIPLTIEEVAGLGESNNNLGVGLALYVEPLPSALHRLFPGDFSSLSAARKACRQRTIFVEGSLGSCQTIVYPEDKLEKRDRASPGDFQFNERIAAALPVLFEDDHMAIVVKPAGMATHGGTASERNSANGAGIKINPKKKSSTTSNGLTVRTALLHALRPSIFAPGGRSDEQAPLRRPTHVHRLDKPTSGLLIAAKTRVALQVLSESFQNRQIKKRYRAIVVGRPKLFSLTTEKNDPRRSGSSEAELSSGTVDSDLGGANAVTEWRVVGDPVESLKFGWLTTLDLSPLTGRKHQLRRHCAEVLGCPILGDLRYGNSLPDSQPSIRDNGIIDDMDDSDDDDDYGGGGGGDNVLNYDVILNLPSLETQVACERRKEENRSHTEARGEARGGKGQDKGAGSSPIQTDGRGCWSGSGLFLAAVELSLRHPTTKKALNFNIPEPPKFEARRRREGMLYKRKCHPKNK
mmetsp:Transcript_86642/g.167871  ORF Transcript_86642/g.167871 Transcript_86642/m.167871 type:complete len:507 (-) Transcript_86642:124-1644(-)